MTGYESWRMIPQNLLTVFTTLPTRHQLTARSMTRKTKRHAVQALRLCTGRTPRRGSRGIALPFHDHGTRRGEGSASRPVRSLPRERPGTHRNRRLGGPQGRSGQVQKISPPTGIRSPDRPARSQSLYRLSYRGQIYDKE